jgi:FkbM family methyltransferase
MMSYDEPKQSKSDMRIAGISIVKNECDIIEVFIRRNWLLLDFLFVVDNISEDSTMEILALLCKEQPSRLKAISAFYLNHQQEQMMTSIIHTLAVDGDFDILFPLDADEILRAPNRESLEKELLELPLGTIGALESKTYVPTFDQNAKEVDPTRRICKRRKNEPLIVHKVVIPSYLAATPGFRIEKGNHNATIDKQTLTAEVLQKCWLAHFPVRSSEQIASKALLGEWALRGKATRTAFEGYHWQRLAQQLVIDSHLTPSQLEQIGCDYAKLDNDNTVVELIEDSLPSYPEISIQYPEKINIDLLARIVHFSDMLTSRLACTPFESEEMRISKTSFGWLAHHMSDTVIGQSIALYGEWAAEELDLLIQLSKPGDNVIDVGANIGTHSIPLAKAVGPKGAVYAFEPQRQTFQMLCTNAQLNSVHNLHAFCYGIGAHRSTGFTPESAAALQGNIGNFSLQSFSEGELVDIFTLDELNLPQIHLIKIDVEGMEKDVIEGGRGLIARDRPVLFVENNIPEKSAVLIKELQSLNYSCYWHLANYYRSNNYYGNPENIFINVNRPEINMVCFPTAAPAWINMRLRVLHPEDNWIEALKRQQEQ